MARLVIDLKEKTKKDVVKMAEKQKVTYKELILNALGLKDEK